jgi:hypothetical protein
MITSALASSHGSSSGSAVIMIVWGLFAMTIGGLHAVNPELSWRLSKWKYRNPEAMHPSDTAMTVTRISGAVFVVVGAVFLVMGLTRI